MLRLPIRTAILVLLATGTANAQPLVQPDWLKAHLSDPQIVVLDIRPHEQASERHIQGAIAADYEHAGWRAKTDDGAGGALPSVPQIAGTIGGLGVGDTTHAVIVGDDFGATARVYWTFKVLGHRDVSILDGGWKRWNAGGYPTTGAPFAARRPATFTAHYDASIRAELPDVERTLASGDRTLLDTRPPAQWLGTAKSPVVRAFGRLPHAVWIDQSEALTADGTALKSEPELQGLFEKAGKAPVTAYCNTGHLAATDWFVLSEVLHHPDVRLYDGSLSQWTSDPSRPIIR